MKSSLSQQLAQKGINVNGYSSGSKVNSGFQQYGIPSQSYHSKSTKKSSVHFNSQSTTFDISSSSIFNSTLKNSANFTSSSKNISLSNLSSMKSPGASNRQNNQSDTNLEQNSELNYIKLKTTPSKDLTCLSHQNILSNMHKRSESSMFISSQQGQNRMKSASQNSSSQKKQDKYFTFQEQSEKNQLANNESMPKSLTKSQSQMQQAYYSQEQKTVEDISDGNKEQIIQLIANEQSSQHVQATPQPKIQTVISQNYHQQQQQQQQQQLKSDYQYSTPKDSTKFFLSLANTSQFSSKMEHSPSTFKAQTQGQQDSGRSNSNNNIKTKNNNNNNNIDHIEQGIYQSNTNTPNHYQITDNLVPFSNLFFSNQLNLLKQKDYKSQSQENLDCQINNKNKMDNILIKESVQSNDNQQLIQNKDKIQQNTFFGNSQISCRTESGNNLNLKKLNCNRALSTNFPTKYTQQKMINANLSPPKIIQNPQIPQYKNQNEDVLIPPSQQEAKQQFQKILQVLELQDQQNLLQELTSLYSSIFVQEGQAQKKQNNMTQKEQDEIINKQNQNVQANISTSTSSLEDVSTLGFKTHKKSKEEVEREEFLKQEEMISLEQRVQIGEYIDLNNDEIFKLVREYYQPQAQFMDKLFNIHVLKISLAELLAIQKWIQAKLLERIDIEKKARLKTEEQTSQMLLNQEKAMQIMENKYQQLI